MKIFFSLFSYQFSDESYELSPLMSQNPKLYDPQKSANELAEVVVENPDEQIARLNQ